MSLAALSRMSEREFRRWMRYAQFHPLPSRRAEAYLAQIASVIAQTAGNENMSIKDFVLDFSGKPAKKAPPDENAMVFANMASVRKLGQGRKKK